jgi:2-(1,2-epoxy-1,2-dihydrophenyl)acetyl-CoA isomerase
MTAASPIADLCRQLYDALERGDAPAVDALLHPAFEAQFADGLPMGIGGIRHGAEAARREGWWAIGRAFDLRAAPGEWIPCADGRLLVRGRYVGHARATRKPIDAAFAHVWTARDGRLIGLWQLTDTALWQAALRDEQSS